MSKKLYVGNLSFQTTADDLIQAFGQFGTVTSASVAPSRRSAAAGNIAHASTGVPGAKVLALTISRGSTRCGVSDARETCQPAGTLTSTP